MILWLLIYCFSRYRFLLISKTPITSKRHHFNNFLCLPCCHHTVIIYVFTMLPSYCHNICPRDEVQPLSDEKWAAQEEDLEIIQGEIKRYPRQLKNSFIRNLSFSIMSAMQSFYCIKESWIFLIYYCVVYIHQWGMWCFLYLSGGESLRCYLII